MEIKIMKLNAEKINLQRQKQNLTWEQVAKLGGLSSRQQAHRKWKNKNVKSAEFFAKVLGVDAKELIMYD